MNKSFIIGGGIVFLVILFGVYFLTRGNGLDYLLGQKDKLEGNLALAQGRLNKEKQTLGAMIKNFQNSSELTARVQGQMKKASDLVKQTDFMFTDPDGSNPRIIVKNLLVYISINNERKNINQLLFEWQQKISARSAQNIDLSESEKIKEDAKIIKSFIEDLSKVTGALTPQNSGLSQVRIDSYNSKLPSLESISGVLASLGAAIESYKINDLQAFDIQTNITTEDNQNYPNSSSPSPSVVFNDPIIAQQVIVAEAQAEVANIEQQLTQVEGQIQEASPLSPVTPLLPETDTTINSVLENQNTNTNNTEYNYTTPPSREPITSQGIIVQPGPPRLIQGTDQF